ncbi:phage tail tape measure protein [Clostridium botulinum]|uniref:phage tail tape measure protein n=1 Tax=Clostridium botulinum TaxID=1491 RepID=UPI001375A256|nr:phage tail tape measure protein [Clostridium botulinum]NCI19871.1 phage tail tape measure protein [Clostridium botulinum]NCI35909.1 phage tail tape measure protein [Clostridium botulinum]NCI71766.1 phage tail tape measure protein [Clostridium botulinum]NDI38682.1 phage tail tape measure protein [Clostridium botulinum]
MGLGIHTSFTLEGLESLTTRVQTLLGEVGDNSKIKLDFSDGMSLDKMQQQINKLQQEIVKASKQSSQTFIKSFDDVNKRFEQQIDQIKNNLKNIGSNVNVNTIKDDYGKIIGALAQYEDKAENVITKNYEIGKSLSEINEKGKYIEKLKAVTDTRLQDQNKIIKSLEEERKKIEELTGSIAKLKVSENGNGRLQSAKISYIGNDNKLVEQMYKIKEDIQRKENVIQKGLSLENTGVNTTENVQKSIKTLEQYQKTIDKLNEKNIKLGDGSQSQLFIKNLEQAQTLIDKTKSSGESMSKSIQKELDILVSKMNFENKTIKENNSEMKKKEKIMKDAPVAIQGYENKIKKLTDSYGKLIKEADLKKLREEMAKLANSKEPEEYARQLKVIKNEFDKLENSVNSGGKKGKGGILDSIGEAMTKFPIWIGATTAWMEAIHKVKDGIGFISNLDKAQTNIAMIADMNKKEVADLTGEYSKLAGQLHTTTLEMMGGAEEFLRAGRSIEETKGLLKASTIGGAISGQDNREVSEQLIAITNGFSNMTEQAQKDGKSYEEVVMHVIDTISTLDNASATSFQEVATAMMRTSSSAQMAGVSFETLASYVATVSATTRKSAESIGESFNVGGLAA